MRETIVGKFIGFKRWEELFDALNFECKLIKSPKLSVWALILALALSCIPIFLTFISQDQNTFVPTIAFGVCALLALIARKRLKIGQSCKYSFKESLSLSHTAVALGCIPAVVIISLFPDLLAQRHDILVESTTQAAPSGEKPTIAFIIFISITYAAWASVTEEVLFRFLLVSVLRRWRIFLNQGKADIFACVLSAMIFGFAHYATWGLAASLALTGIGIGFGLAYIATQERLEPVLLYHFIFDILSITAAQL